MGMVISVCALVLPEINSKLIISRDAMKGAFLTIAAGRRTTSKFTQSGLPPAMVLISGSFIEAFVIPVPVGIPGGLLIEILFQRKGQVYTRLVGQANQHPKHVGHLIAQVFPLIRRF